MTSTSRTVGGTVGTMRNERTGGLFWIRSIACALWLMARDHTPVSVEMAGDGSGVVLFGFSQDIEAALPLLHQHRGYLNDLTMKAKTGSK